MTDITNTETTETNTEIENDPLAEFAGKTTEELAAEVLKLRKHSTTAIGEKRSLAEKFKDIDPEVYKQLLSDKETREQEAESKKSDLDKLNKTYSDEKGVWEGKEKTYLSTIQELKVNSVLKAAIAENEGNDLFLLPHLKDRVKLGVVDGEFVAQVLDDAGEVEEGKTIADLVAAFRKDERFAGAFKSPIKSGSNAKTSPKTTGGVNPWAKETLNWSEQGRLEAENPVLAAQYKAAAGVK